MHEFKKKNKVKLLLFIFFRSYIIYRQQNFWYNLAEPEIETKMHNKIMGLTKLITVVLRIANKEQLNQIKDEQIMQPNFRSFWNYGHFLKI